jgi:hypothetical protein
MSKFTFSSAHDLLASKHIGWRVLNVLPAKGLVVMWGASGSGKSFAAFELAACVARGEKFHGKRVKQGLVLYVAAEGNMRTRTRAYLQEHGLQPQVLGNMSVLEGNVNMLDDTQDLAAFISAIQEWLNGRELALVVFDTLNRVMCGGNENGSEDMGAVIRNVKRIEDCFGCATMLIHHSGKDESKGTRGHSSLKGAMDAEISITRAEDIRTFRIEKQKESEDYYDLFNFRLKTVDLGALSTVDPDAEWHERITSCVLEVTDDAPVTKSASKHATLFQEALDESGTGAKEDVRAAYYLKHGGKEDAKRQAFTRDWKKHMDKLSEKAA